ncbi:UNVERIFIED_CONTAM: Major facilitator superfamily domain-containing protein 6 [Trichonephila clavipes]
MALFPEYLFQDVINRLSFSIFATTAKCFVSGNVIVVTKTPYEGYYIIDSLREQAMTEEKNGKNGDIYTLPSPESSSEKKEEVKRGFWHINRETLRFKFHFFLFMGALSVVLPFISVIFSNRIGLTASSIATLLIFSQFLSMVSKPLLGYLADYSNKLKAIIGVLTVIQVVFFFLLLAIPAIRKNEDPDKRTNSTVLKFMFDNLSSTELTEMCQPGAMPFNSSFGFLYDGAKSFNNTCSEYITAEISSDEVHSNEDYLVFFNNTSMSLVAKRNASVFATSCGICCKSKGTIFSLPCHIQKNKSVELSSETDHVSEFKTLSFWLSTLFLSTAMICSNSLFTLSDTACCESVAKTGADFGRQRLWGAISWGLISPISGILVDYTGDYLASWILMAIIYALTLWNIKGIDMVKPTFSQNILKDVGKVLKSKEFLSYLLGVFMNGISTGFVWFYLMLFLNEIGASRFLLGMAQCVQAFVGEIPCMFFSGWFIKKFGYFNILTLSLLSYWIRFMWYSYLYNPWLVLPVEWLHGISYGVYYPAVAAYAKLSAKPGTEATTQAVLFTTHEGIGAGIGCILAGFSFDAVGPHRTFFNMSFFTAGGMALNIILYFCIWRRKGSINVSPEADT